MDVRECVVQPKKLWVEGIIASRDMDITLLEQLR